MSGACYVAALRVEAWKRNDRRGFGCNVEGKVTLKTSTDAKIVVWRNGDLYCAMRIGVATRPDECLAIDLFEVVAELAELDLERADHAAEAVELSETAQRRLAMSDDSAPTTSDDEDDVPDQQSCNGG